MSSFYSILVRLKVSNALDNTRFLMFLFHTGSIKRRIKVERVRLLRERFLFHTGSIKSADSTTTTKTNVQFLFHTGSIKSGIQTEKRYHTSTFLFHTGSIKSPNIELEVSTNRYAFLFHTGSIKSLRAVTNDKEVTVVSIPYWVD